MILAVVQARMSSSRLPGKALLEAAGKPLLAHVVDRLKRAKSIGKIVLATGDGPANDPIRDLAEKLGVDCFSGSEDDVLDRFFQAARPYAPKAVVRVTGDCPLLDPEVVDRLVATLGDSDIAGTGPSFPEGIDAEAISFAPLEAAWNEAKLPSEREHVTAFIWKRPERFVQKRLEHSRDLSKIRVTCDEPQDFEVLKTALAYFKDNPSGVEDIAAFFEARPELAALNSDIVRNEGYLLSLAKEKRKQ